MAETSSGEYTGVGGKRAAERRASSEGGCVLPADASRPEIVYPSSEDERTRTPGASCQALRLAVAQLSRLDDFTTENIGRGFFSEVYRVSTDAAPFPWPMGENFSLEVKRQKKCRTLNRN